MPVAFISDIHLGRTGGVEDRDRETDLVAFLRHLGPELSALFLVGDVFDAYIEYRSVLPKGAYRLVAELDRLVDLSVPVTYILGNHDPWHRDFFSEIGIEIVAESVVKKHYGRSILVAHGDQAAARWSLYGFLRPMLRSRLLVGIYRNLLPVDLGYALARFVKNLVSSQQPSPENVERLRRFAFRQLARPDIDSVVLGHSHQAEICTNRDGTYVNAGEWDRLRQAVLLDEQGFRVVSWTSEAGESVIASEESQRVPIV
jgi:UDP-2,3-diacylglucosamine hydrolase